MKAVLRKTPEDTTEFERDQLRFLLTSGDFAVTLAEINPSLAWLPILAEMNLISDDRQLAPWIQKNFDDAEAIKEVAANIRFFGPEAAEILNRGLDRSDQLSELLAKSWRLIIRHMKNNERGKLVSEWFDIEPRLKRGDHSPEVLHQLVHVITPKLKIGKRLSWGNVEETAPLRPSDLMSVDYEIEDFITEDEVLAAWPVSTHPDLDDQLIRWLTQSLSETIVDAIEVGVESNNGYGLTDSDVPSVGKHRQNEYRTGFLTITRVLAELWTRLAEKETVRALVILEIWKTSALRLVRRLAMFAAADQHVSGDDAASVLLSIPQGELFLTNSSVESYRLAKTRWNDFSGEQKRSIEARIIEGPPPNWFKRDSDIERIIDRARYDFLEHLSGDGIELDEQLRVLLEGIRHRYPEWVPRPQEQAGFHVWHCEASYVSNDSSNLDGVNDEDLVAKAKEINDRHELIESDIWQGLCQTDAPRALRGLISEGNAGRWDSLAWRPFLWAANKIESPETARIVASSLLQMPQQAFVEVLESASWWMEERAKHLDDDILWPLWDRIEVAAPRTFDSDYIKDAFGAALNAPPGHLATVVLKKLEKGNLGKEMPGALLTRFDKLADATGIFGKLARVRLAAALTFLFERAPEWTTQKIIPLFYWSSGEARAVWSARKYFNYIGSPKLMSLLKESFLTLFKRNDIPKEDIRIFADWLAVIAIVNIKNTAGYPISMIEIRSALRQAPESSLSSIGHRLAIEMENAKPEEKVKRWREVVGPVFTSIWPLDVELQTSSSNFKLVQILRATGDAFPDAADVIIPFIRAEDERQNTSVYSISEASEILYRAAPEKMLELLTALLGDAPAGSAFGLSKALDRLRKVDPALAKKRKFQKLEIIAGR